MEMCRRMQKVKDLLEILTWCRGAGTASESQFVGSYIATIPGIRVDEYGNYHLTIGKEPIILWSCHTDTVTQKVGRQNVKWLGNGILGLHNPQMNQCLGADDGAGLWIMLELIKAGKEGHYVFHRDEEIGGQGSAWLTKPDNWPKYIPMSVKATIAMDRCGREDIITHQMYQRTCSDAFADSLAEQLPYGMRKDDSGVFTDTANYVDIIGECTNLAVGYERNHGPSETLDTEHVRELRDSLVMLDISKLDFVRNPGEYEYADFYHGYYPSKEKDYGNPAYRDGDEIWDNYGGSNTAVNPLAIGLDMELEDMVSEAPAVAAKLLTELGVTHDEFRAHVYALTGRLLCHAETR
jgi:hypothetical protein